MASGCYIGNSYRKEYIDCPFGCELRLMNPEKDQKCYGTMLLWALKKRWTDNEPIKIYWDHYNDLPWWIEEGKWKNIASELLAEMHDNNEQPIKHANHDLPPGDHKEIK